MAAKSTTLREKKWNTRLWQIIFRINDINNQQFDSDFEMVDGELLLENLARILPTEDVDLETLDDDNHLRKPISSRDEAEAIKQKHQT